MNIKEAITEIEKRYKVGDKIPCMSNMDNYMYFKGIESVKQVNIGDESIWVWLGDGVGMVCKDGKWSEPIREEKNLWNFFKSIEGTYPDVVEKYLRNLDFSFTIEEGMDNLILGAFDWDIPKEGYDYWENINELYTAYLEN